MEHFDNVYRMDADRLIAVGNLLISLATAIGLVVSTWFLNGRIDRLDGRIDALDGRIDALDGKIDDLSGKFDRLTGRVDALETSHTAHVNSGLHAG